MDLLRYVAFSATQDGGNPAGVVLDADGMSDAQMLAVANDVGYSETAFLHPGGVIRYFSPLAEVPFCGHATIATAVALAERSGPGSLRLHSRAGDVTVTTFYEGEELRASLVSVEPRTTSIRPDLLDDLLRALRWSASDLDPALPPMAAFAGAWHPIIAATDPGRLADLSYDFDHLAELMAAQQWTTINVITRLGTAEFSARNPFPPGGVVEDPATGAAAAALGGYLRAIDAVHPPAQIVVHQGAHIGRPSVLTVDIPATGGIHVTGTGTQITD